LLNGDDSIGENYMNDAEGKVANAGSVDFPTLFDLVGGRVERVGPSVGDDAVPGIQESIGPTVGDDGILILVPA
jgi:hypothetical protein